MKYNSLGNTDIKVSKLCYGTGTLSDKNPKDVKLLLTAYKHGINFWDTADCYHTQKTVGKAAKKIGRKNIIIQTKIDSFKTKEAKKAIATALKELKTNYIDIVLLHHVDTLKEFSERMPAFKELQKLKKEGIIKAIGFSTHSVKVAKKYRAKADVILSPIHELRIKRGTRKEMIHALKTQKNKGKAIIAMKVFGGKKNSHKDCKKRMQFARNLKFVDSFCIGMKDKKEIIQNAKFFS